jgi:hypothetical protein
MWKSRNGGLKPFLRPQWASQVSHEPWLGGGIGERLGEILIEIGYRQPT